MSKKVKVLVSVLVAILLLTVSGTAVVMAQEEPEEELQPPALQAGARGLLARVAEILDIPQEDMVSAFKQASEEMRQECQVRAEETFNQRLNEAIENGRITQEEAAAIREWRQQKPLGEVREWLEQKPEALRANLSPRAFGGSRHRALYCLRLPRLAD